MHFCNGSLCSSCRARMLGLMLRDHGQTPPDDRRTTAQTNITRGAQSRHSQQSVQSLDAKSGLAAEAKDRADLLKLLAEDGASRSVKEQLHSRLLSGLHNKPHNSKASMLAAHSSYCPTFREPDLRSHFSDSSDDETTGGSGECSGGSREGVTTYHASSNRGHRSKRTSKGHQSRARKREDQEVFDLEI